MTMKNHLGHTTSGPKAARPDNKVRNDGKSFRIDDYFSALLMDRYHYSRRGSAVQIGARDEARADEFDYVERFYSPRRRHWKLG